MAAWAIIAAVIAIIGAVLIVTGHAVIVLALVGIAGLVAAGEFVAGEQQWSRRRDVLHRHLGGSRSNAVIDDVSYDEEAWAREAQRRAKGDVSVRNPDDDDT